MRIAVIGAGIAGMGASWALARRHEVTLFERESRLGGHANTAMATIDGHSVAVDTGFIVYNTVNYPHLTRLFETLGVPTVPSNMSFAVSLGGGRWEMAGRPTGLFGSPEQFASPSHWRLLAATLRFFREAEEALGDPATEHERLGDWLVRQGYDAGFVARFLVPMAAAIWSSSPAAVLDYPVRPFVSFFRNHGLLKLAGRVRWRTVDGGSARYVERLAADMVARQRIGMAVARVVPGPGGPTVVTADGDARRFDAVVLAVHGDTAARLLANDPSDERRAVLGAFRYQANEAVLHRDPGFMPRRRRLWSSWNYGGEAGGAIAVTYWMNRLQPLTTRTPLFVTLNPPREPAAGTVLGRFAYDHPQYDLTALGAQARLSALQGRDGLWFSGSYTGHGFHEDGLRSGLEVAAALGAPAPWWSEADGERAPWTRTPAPCRAAAA